MRSIEVLSHFFPSGTHSRAQTLIEQRLSLRVSPCFNSISYELIGATQKFCQPSTVALTASVITTASATTTATTVVHSVYHCILLLSRW